MPSEEPGMGQVPPELRALDNSFATATFSAAGKLLRANERFRQLFGGAGRAGRPIGDPFAFGKGTNRKYRLSAGVTQNEEFLCTDVNGQRVWIDAMLTPMIGEKGSIEEVVFIASDVTDHKLKQAGLQGQIEAINRSQCVLTLAMDGTILDANQQMLTVLDYKLEEIRGKNHQMFMAQIDANSQEYANFWSDLCSGTFRSGMYKRFGKAGKEIWLQATYNPILDLNGNPTRVSTIATDVSSNVALAEAYEDAVRKSQHDTATALPNRARLSTFINTTLSVEKAQLTVLYIDIDRFKSINDTLGHHVGDCVLGEVADRLRRALKGDQMVARIGGDEFVIAAPGLPPERLEPFCQGLLEVAREPIRNENEDLTISLSIGVAVAPADGKTPDELLQAADTALYQAKQDGRDCYRFYAHALNDRIRADGSMADEMRRGIEAGEFYLEYQPRFDTLTGRIRCLEALVRWAHPEHGLISPGEFIAVAERSGLIVPLGDWILHTACRQATTWPGAAVSVNVSPIQFKDGGFTDVVKDALAQSGLEAERLEIEITEGVLLEDAVRAREMLQALKALGATLAMDDFGTGYSSLSYLQQFPFDIIKIDRKFIADLETNEGGRAIVQAILGLGRALGMSVTAEGVETDEQLAILVRDRCQEVQGFLFSRPLMPEKVDELFDRLAELEVSEPSERKALNM